MIKASDIVVNKVKKAAIDRLVKSGHSIKEAEALFDKLMDKLANQMATNVGGVGTGKAEVNPASITPQGQQVRQLTSGKGPLDNRRDVGTGDIHNYVKNARAATDDELMLCKAATICAGIKYGLSPLTSLRMFDLQLEKYADELLKDSQSYESDLKAKAKFDRNMMKYYESMRRTGLRNAQGVGGFNVQDQLSKQRIDAIINGLAAVPLTAATALTEGGKNVASKIRRVQPQ